MSGAKALYGRKSVLLSAVKTPAELMVTSKIALTEPERPSLHLPCSSSSQEEREEFSQQPGAAHS